MNSVLEKFSGSHDDTKSKIESALVHVQTYYCHSSLGTMLKVERIGDIMHIDDSFGIIEVDSKKVLDITRQNIETADLMIYVTGEFNGWAYGKAGCIGCVCDTEIANLPTTVQPPGGGGSTCQDTHSSCADMAKNGDCTNENESWMDANCKKSCGKCNGGGDDTEIAQIREASSRNWEPIPIEGGRYNANVWLGDLLDFALVSYKFDEATDLPLDDVL